MTPQEKAKELVAKYADEFNFDDTYRGYKQQSKQCALIVVNEILNLMINSFKWDENHNGNVEFWQEVKQEIEKL